VEEAAQVLRIGRTKAYAMARQWRASGGRSGLPVIDLGNVLRVPLHALKHMIAAELRWSPELSTASAQADDGASSPGTQAGRAKPSTASPAATQRSRDPSHTRPDQPALFEPPLT
jgi:hypothetical protein